MKNLVIFKNKSCIFNMQKDSKLELSKTVSLTSDITKNVCFSKCFWTTWTWNSQW